MINKVRSRYVVASIWAACLWFAWSNISTITTNYTHKESAKNVAHLIQEDIFRTNILSGPPFSRTLNLLDTSISYLQAENDSFSNLNPQGTTIEFWIEIPSNFQGKATVIEKQGAYWIATYESQGFLYLEFSGVSVLAANETNFPGWHHMAVTYAWDSETQFESIKYFFDGHLISASNSGPSSLPATDNQLIVGRMEHLAIDELRISDSLRYQTDNFETSTAAYTCDSETIALWHFDEEPSSSHASSCGAKPELVPMWKINLPYITLDATTVPSSHPF